MQAVMTLVTTALFALALGACSPKEAIQPGYDYAIATAGTRSFRFDTDSGPGVIKVLIEEQNLGSAGAEMAEIEFPPGYHGVTHPHELEIIYVLDGALDHIVNGESHILTPGMVGVVREPDVVVHRSASPAGARVLVVWPLGGEVAGFDASGMPQTPLTGASGNTNQLSPE